MRVAKLLMLFGLIGVALMGALSIGSVTGPLVQAQDRPEIGQLEKGLLPPVLIKGEAPWSLAERMEFYKVPGLSIAVVQDFKIIWSRAYGFKDVQAKEPVEPGTLFQAASCSKPFAALAALKLVQEGRLTLDGSVNEVLKSWQLPENSLTAAQKVTLKQLLSHSAGVTVHGFRGYGAGEKLPTLLQVLEGQAPANSSPIRVDMEPGKEFRYSGGGYCLVQQLLMDTYKQPFPILMEDQVLKPLGMTRSTFWQPLPEARVKEAATGYNSMGLPLAGKWHTYPEMAAAGLWTTAEDMARLVVELQLSMKNKSNKILSQEKTTEMLSPYNSNFMGLGLMISRRGEDIYFQHGGGNEGFRCFLIGHVNKGYGAVVMTNSDNGDGLFNEIMRGIARIYQWSNYLPQEYELVPQTPEKLKALVGKYEMDSDHLLTVTEENGHLYALITTLERSELYPVGENRFVRKDSVAEYEFFKDAETGKVTHVEASRNDGRRGYLKVDDTATVPMDLLLAGQLEQAAAAYRALKARNAEDPNVDTMRLLGLTENFIGRGLIPEGMVLLHLAAEFNPEFIKSMSNTLNTEIRLLLDNPSIPEPYKEQIKASYNMMLRKLGLKEIQ